jgi:hypothetical protein
MELQLTELLNLTDVEVEYYQNLGQELIVTVHSPSKNQGKFRTVEISPTAH